MGLLELNDAVIESATDPRAFYGHLPLLHWLVMFSGAALAVALFSLVFSAILALISQGSN